MKKTTTISVSQINDLVKQHLGIEAGTLEYKNTHISPVYRNVVLGYDPDLKEWTEVLSANGDNFSDTEEREVFDGLKVEFSVHLYKVFFDTNYDQREVFFYFSDAKDTPQKFKNFRRGSPTRNKLQELITIVQEAEFNTMNRYESFVLEDEILKPSYKYRGGNDDDFLAQIQDLMRDG